MNSINIFSNPREVFEKAKKYLGGNVIIKLSDRKSKKYMVLTQRRTNGFTLGKWAMKTSPSTKILFEENDI
jgi:hypothetical protein